MLGSNLKNLIIEPDRLMARSMQSMVDALLPLISSQAIVDAYI